MATYKWMYEQPPTEKQINFAQYLCEELDTFFPCGAHEYNKGTYCDFISWGMEQLRTPRFKDEHLDYEPDEWDYEYYGCFINDFGL